LEVWAGAAARQPPLGCTIGGITEMDKMKKWEVWMSAQKRKKQGQSGRGAKEYKGRRHKSRERNVLWCMTATEWKNRMRESKSRKQYWDEGQQLQHNEGRKTVKWNKKRKIGRRKRLRKEYLKVQTPQNYIHEHSTGCYLIHQKKSATLRTPTNPCLLPALTTCSTVMVVILLWCQNRQIPRLSL
jgi:hypothetical protein